MYDDLKEQIRSRIEKCSGEWVGQKNGYEGALCAALGIELQETRYQDGTWQAYSIELKKGTSIWLDLVRYSEILLEKPDLNSRKSIGLFCVPDNKKGIITDVIGVSTPSLLRKLALSDAQARALLELRDHVPRQLNAQASLTVKDVRGIADFSVGFLDSLL